MDWGSALGGLLTGGLSLGGSLISGSLNKSFQREMMQAQQNFIREMASTQYQRAVKDLRAAGLNPILAVGGGVHGASGAASVSTGSSPYSSDLGIGDALSSFSAMQSNERRKDEIKVMDKNAAVAQQNADTSRSALEFQEKQADAALKNAATNSSLASSTTAKQAAEAESIRLNNDMRQMELNYFKQNPAVFSSKMVYDSFGRDIFGRLTAENYGGKFFEGMSNTSRRVMEYLSELRPLRDEVLKRIGDSFRFREPEFRVRGRESERKLLRDGINVWYPN